MSLYKLLSGKNPILPPQELISLFCHNAAVTLYHERTVVLHQEVRSFSDVPLMSLVKVPFQHDLLFHRGKGYTPSWLDYNFSAAAYCSGASQCYNPE
jgi:hypothetical protein